MNKHQAATAADATAASLPDHPADVAEPHGRGFQARSPAPELQPGTPTLPGSSERDHPLMGEDQPRSLAHDLTQATGQPGRVLAISGIRSGKVTSGVIPSVTDGRNPEGS